MCKSNSYPLCLSAPSQPGLYLFIFYFDMAVHVYFDFPLYAVVEETTKDFLYYFLAYSI